MGVVEGAGIGAGKPRPRRNITEEQQQLLNEERLAAEELAGRLAGSNQEYQRWAEAVTESQVPMAAPADILAHKIGTAPLVALGTGMDFLQRKLIEPTAGEILKDIRSAQAIARGDVTGAAALRKQDPGELWRSITLPWGVKGTVENIVWGVLPGMGITKVPGLKQLPKLAGDVLGKSRVPVAKALGAEVKDTIEDKLARFIESVKPLTAETVALQKEEMAKRAATGAVFLREGTGAEAFQEAMGSLRGKLPTAERAVGAAETLAPNDIAQLWERARTATFRHVTKDSEKEFFKRVNTFEALQKLLMEGQNLQRSEIRLLEEVFGEGVAKVLLRRRPLSQKAWEGFLDVANVPRTLLSAWDLSAPLRQGVLLAAGHPIEWFGNLPRMVKALASERYAVALEETLATRRLAQVADDAGLYLAPRTAMAERLAAREEAFMSRFARMIPGVRQSERAYISFLNKLRADTFDNIVTGWEKAGTNTFNRRQKLASYLNHATGRGDLPAFLTKGGGGAELLNAVFFSPRLLLSRPQVLVDLATAKGIRGEIAKDLAAFVGTGVGILSLASLAGAEVELDPRSADFGKTKVGKTRLDFWGGYQPIARFVVQLITNQRKTTGRGEIVGLDRIATVGRFIKSKLSPGLGFATDVATGETFTGDEMSWEPGGVLHQAYERLTPLFVQDLVDAINEEGLVGGMVALPGALGVGVVTFSGLSDLQDKVAGEMFPGTKGFLDLNRGQQIAVNQHPNIVKARKAMAEKGVLSVQEQTTAAVQRWETRNSELESGLRSVIDKGMKGPALGEAIKEFKRSRFEAANTLFSEAVSKELSKGKKGRAQLAYDLAEQYYNVELSVDPQSGYQDWDAFDAEREEILSRAETAGVAREDVLARKPYADPKLQEVIGEYDKAMEALRAYWDVGKDVVAQQPPAVQQLWAQYERATKAEQQMMLMRTPVLGQLNTLIEKVRTALRLKPDNDYDVLLVRWFGYKPASPRGVEEWLEQQKP